MARSYRFGTLVLATVLTIPGHVGKCQVPDLNVFRGLELFLDDELISWTRNLQRELKQPRKHAGNPVVRPEYPWEKKYATIHGTVLWDEPSRMFRMWYNAFGANYKRDQFLAYAESKDGFEWRKPFFDLVPFEGYAKTNILLGREVNIHGFCLLRDPKSPVGNQYLLFFDSYSNRRPGPSSEPRAVYVASSPDGIHFTPPDGRMIVPGKSDTGQSAVWNPERKRFQLFMRGVNEYDEPDGGHQRERYVRMAESEDSLHWSQPIELLRADAIDHAPDGQMHQLSVTRYDGYYVGLLTLFQIERYETNADFNGERGLKLEHGKTDTQLAVSRDGLHWTRVADRKTFLPLGSPGEWDAGWIVTSSEFVIQGNELRIYYGGAPARFSLGTTSIGVATLPRDRFVAMKPRRLNAEGILELKPYHYPEGDLVLNADAGRGGRIVAEVLDFGGNVIKGCERSNFKPITSDGERHQLRWSSDGKERDLIAALGPNRTRAVRLRFYVTNGEIYSLRTAR